MTNEEFNFDLEDRISKIRSINELHDLENKWYISFSGGADSCVASALIDEALPGNKIPRVYINTGMEYIAMIKFVKKLAEKDSRIIIVNSGVNIPKMLKRYGYPFKSKDYSSLNYTYYSRKSKGFDVCENYKKRISGEATFDPVPNILKYQFIERPFLISDKCCVKLKESVLDKWGRDNKRPNTITGIRRAEGGRRKSTKGCLTSHGTKFHPLLVVSNEWEEEYIKRRNIDLCPLYYPPFSFNRTGCKGCPFNRDIQDDLNKLYDLLPSEYYQCLHIWKPVYEEYIRIGYRLKYYPHEKEAKETK